MKRNELNRYEIGKKLTEDIDRVKSLLECLHNGAAIHIDGFEVEDYWYLPEGIKDKTRAMYINSLERELKKMEQRFEKL
ncbi:hypothetical protein [Megasphaera massiliensis]|uniref:hypothetical protein n=1 Tax=Megasphaera massiliensis TaxID=1232428 RepID=UPI0003FF2374|nr:hypothetical protein [Megasphaera massiliensis]